MSGRRTQMLRLTLLLAAIGLVAVVGGTSELAAQAQTFDNPFIPNEKVGVIDETGNFSNVSIEAQSKLNTTFSCALFSAWVWFLKPFLIVFLFGTFFWEMFKTIKGAGSESASKMLWTLLGIMMFVPVGGRGHKMYDQTIIDTLVKASGVASCPVSGNALKEMIEKGNPIVEPSSTGTTPGTGGSGGSGAGSTGGGGAGGGGGSW